MWLEVMQHVVEEVAARRRTPSDGAVGAHREFDGGGRPLPATLWYGRMLRGAAARRRASAT
jgi:hypothetical protein